MSETKRTPFDKVDNVVFRTLKYVSYLAVFFLAAIMVLAFVNVVLEKLKKVGVPVSSIADTANWIKFMNVGVVYLATAYVTLERGHSGVDLLTRHYPKVVQSILHAIAHLCGGVIISYITYLGYVKVLTVQLANNARINDTLASSFPQWPFGVLYLVGMGLLAFSQFWGFLRICMGRPAASNAVSLEEQSEALLAQAEKAAAHLEEMNENEKEGK